MNRLLTFLLLGCFLVGQFAVDTFADVVTPPKTQVYSLSEVDHPPQLMVAFKPKYPAALNGTAIAGEVVVECVVDIAGVVRDPIVKSSTQNEFELPALQCVAKWKYRPGRKGKNDVNVRTELTVKFDPKKH